MATTQERDTGARSGIDKYFMITERGSSVSTEMRAGLTTFLAMAYIIFVNPSILSNAIDFEGSFPQLLTVTCFAAAFGTILMGLWAKLPFALAPGMGLNAFFTFTVVFGLGYEWQTALGAVFISGLLFVVLSATGARAWIINGIPLYLKYAITAGIGLFLAIIGFQTGGITIGDPATLVGQGEWLSLEVAIGLVGFIVMASLLALRVKGALIIGIALVTVLAILTDAQVYVGPDGPTSFQGFNDGIIGFTWPGDLIGALDISGALGAGILGVAFTFLFVDFFDTAGTLIGLSDKAGMLDEKGHIQAPRQAFVVDGTATTVGAVLGTSSTTTYVESAAGVEDGARTGLAAVTVGVLFLLATVLSPLASVIPAVATAPVLIIIGAMMMTGAAKIEWTDYRVAIPAFVTIVGMPFTYSITAGIALGIISYTLISVCVGKWREVHVVMYILTALLLLWASGVFL